MLKRNSNWSVPKYLETHPRFPDKMRDAHRTEIMDTGSSDERKLAFSLSFQDLSPSSRTMLGVFSFLAPDKILECLLAVRGRPEGDELPSHLRFCADEFK
jgi:hypothetical protein